MIELHSHVLPGLDDGARNLEESLQLLAQYAEQGVTTVVCTPHLLPETFASNETLMAFLDLRDARLAQLQAAADAQQIAVTLLPGAELMLSTAILASIRKPDLAARLTINRGSYILVELPRTLNGGLRTLEGLLFEIQLAGLLPVLAHPERIAHNEGVLPVLREWVAGGRVLLQANAGHLADDERLDGERQKRYRGRQGVAWEMIRNGMVCVVASDAHDPVARPVQNGLGYRAIERLMGQAEAIRLMVGNPEQVINDGPVLGQRAN